MNPRILLVTGDWPPGLSGVGDYAARLATSLQTGGTHVSVLTTDRPGLQQLPGIDLLTTPDWKLRRAPALRKLLVGFDLVHVQYPAIDYGRSPLINLLPLLCGGARSLVTIHDFRVMRRRWRARTLPMLLAADALACVDRDDVPAIRHWCRRTASCLPIASNIDPVPTTSAQAEALRRELKITDGEFVFAYFGIIYPHKGLPELIDAVDLLRRLFEVRLLVIGDFDREAPWRAAIERRLRGEGVTWARGADAARVSRLLQTADAAALPFHTGAASNRSSLLAAMVHGLPTVTTAGPATPSQFDNDFPVLLVPPQDTAALTAALRRLVEDEALRAQLAQAATARGARLSWQAVAAQHADLYEQCLTRPAAMKGATREGA